MKLMQVYQDMDALDVGGSVSDHQDEDDLNYNDEIYQNLQKFVDGRLCELAEVISTKKALDHQRQDQKAKLFVLKKENEKIEATNADMSVKLDKDLEKQKKLVSSCEMLTNDLT